MGIPRSQLYARAVSEFLKKHKRDQITQKLNDVYEKIEEQTGGDLSTDVSIETLRDLTRNDSW